MSQWKSAFSDEVDNISKVLNNSINTDNISNKRRPSVVVNRYPERQHDFTNNRQNLNGSTTYRKKSIKVLCESIPKGIRSKEFNRHIKHGVAHIKSFPCSTVKQLHQYSLPTLDENPDVVIIHVGINDYQCMKLIKHRKMKLRMKS